MTLNSTLLFNADSNLTFVGPVSPSLFDITIGGIGNTTTVGNATNGSDYVFGTASRPLNNLTLQNATLSNFIRGPLLINALGAVNLGNIHIDTNDAAVVVLANTAESNINRTVTLTQLKVDEGGSSPRRVYGGGYTADATAPTTPSTWSINSIHQHPFTAKSWTARATAAPS
ncbi:MAG: hypothetical protein HC841_07690 [Verrucomicrobiae bacterium]|nr:hypothetical protein [Verrucomicrobiae bacterium]